MSIITLKLFKSRFILLLFMACILIGIFMFYTHIPESAAALPAIFQTEHDNIPNFAQNPTIQTVANGSWSQTAVWNLGRLPSANDIVLINHAVTYDTIGGDVDVIGVNSGAMLRFSNAQDTRLRVGTLLVMPGGSLEVGTVQSPIPADRTTEIIIKNKSLDANVDPSQFGTGLISLGKVTMHGAAVDPTFIRLASEPLAGQTVLQLSQTPTGWKTGDKVIIPDSRHMKGTEISNWQVISPQWEEKTIQSVSGSTITLSSPLNYDHKGARDGNGKLDFLPHVGNFSRNVMIRSENPLGTGVNGHTLFTDRAEADVRYVLFKDLGRTNAAATGPGNQIGRYAVHAHHLMGPAVTPANGYQFTLIGNAIDGGSGNHNRRWGMTIHGSHYGLIKDNVGYHYNGAIMATEDGSESYNVIDNNFVVRGNGNGDFAALDGNEGGGFWFRGPNNYIRNNVAADIQGTSADAAYGYKFAMRYLDDIKIPNYKGADMADAGQYTLQSGNKLPILQFENNEAYSAQSGLTYWWVNTYGGGSYDNPNALPTVFKDLKLWHIYNKNIFHYPAVNITFDGLTIRGSGDSGAACCGDGLYFPDYSTKIATIRNADIQGMKYGIFAPSFLDGLLTIENSYLRNRVNIIEPVSYAVGNTSLSGLPDKTVLIKNVRMEAWPGTSLRTIQTFYPTDGGRAPLVSPQSQHLVWVRAYQGNLNDNFDIYYTDTRVQPRPPANCNLNNRPEIGGIVCLISGSSTPTPTATPTPSLTPIPSTTPTLDITVPIISSISVTNLTPFTASINWTTNEPADGQIQFLNPCPSTGCTSPLVSTLSTTHVINVSNLLSNTTYPYQIKSKDAAGNSATANQSFTTAVQSTPTPTPTPTPSPTPTLTPTLSQSGIIFEDNFNQQADWTIPQGSGSCWTSDCNLPAKWSGYYNGGSYCSDPGHNNFYIGTPNARGGSGKALTFWDESCTAQFGNSDGQVGVNLGQVYQNLFIRFFIKFQPNYQWESFGEDKVVTARKLLHIQYHEGPGIPWNYFGNRTNMPLAIPGIHNYISDSWYNTGYRCEINYYCQGTPSYTFGVGTDQDIVRMGPWFQTGSLGDGQWHSVEFQYKMNTNTGGVWNSDGAHRFWLDGVLRYETTNIPFSDNGSILNPRRGWNYFSIGGNNNNYWNKTCNGTACEQWVATDDVVISTNYIGPNYIVGGGTTPTPTPSTSSGPSVCDPNKDSQTNILDFQLLANVVLGISVDTEGYDINKDGQVNILDTQVLANVILGKTSCP